MPKFLLTLVAFKHCGFTEVAIKSILANTNPETFHLVLVDNGSNDPTTDLFKSYIGHPNITVKFNPENIGFPAAVNQGIDYFYEHKEYDYFTTVHSDTACVSQDWNLKLLNIFNKNPHIQCLGGLATNQDEIQPKFGNIYTAMKSHKPNLVNQPGTEVERVLNLCYDNNLTCKVAEIESAFGNELYLDCDNAFLSFSRNLVESVGYFDESFFPGMGEDSDYYNRMCRLGHKIWRTGSVYTHHWCSVTYFGIMDGRQVFDRAMGRLIAKNTYDQECLKYSCYHNQSGKCGLGKPVGSVTVCSNYTLNSNYNKVNSQFFPYK